MKTSQSRTIALARRIADLAIRSDWPAGRRVTEMELANALGVSRTPIRRAMGVLAQEGALKGQKNKGFCLSKAAHDLSQLRLEPVPAATDRLYGRIVKDRISNILPQVVRQAMLARRYAANRPLLEQVLARLEADGLLFRGNGRDWRFVDTMNEPDTISTSYDVRIILEPAALNLASKSIDLEGLRSLRQRHKEMLSTISDVTRAGPPKRLPRLTRSPAVSLDAEFHIAIANLSCNPFVVATIRQHVELRRLLEHKVSADPWHVETWCREHLRIIDAILDGNRDIAAQALSEHLRRAKREALAGVRAAKRRR